MDIDKFLLNHYGQSMWVTQMVSLLTKNIEERGDMTITAAEFDNASQMPDYVGYRVENENPEFRVSGVPDEAESLVLVCDDPDAQAVVGFTFDHWLVWDIDPGIESIPRNWSPEGKTTVGYNDFVEKDFSGPAPPDDAHGYRFKMLALDTTLGLQPQARKAVIQMTVLNEAEILAASQIIGRYQPNQAT